MWTVLCHLLFPHYENNKIMKFEITLYRCPLETDQRLAGKSCNVEWKTFIVTVRVTLSPWLSVTTGHLIKTNVTWLSFNQSVERIMEMNEIMCDGESNVTCMSNVIQVRHIHSRSPRSNSRSCRRADLRNRRHEPTTGKTQLTVNSKYCSSKY